MKKLFFTSVCLLFVVILFMGQTSQDGPQKWNIEPQSTGQLDPTVIHPAPLPMEYDYFNPTAKVEYYNTPIGTFAVFPSLIALPRAGSTQTEVIICRHPLNPLIMYGSSNAINNPSGTLFISEGTYVTTNGGVSWFGSDTMKNTVGTILTGHGGDPGPTIDKDGRFIITHLGGGIKANYSTNNGLSWSNDVTIITGSQDKNLSTTDDAPSSAFYGRSYTAWTRFTNPWPIAISYTTNGGVSWSAAADINAPTVNQYSQGTDLRVGPSGEVYVCWAQPSLNVGNIEDACGFAKSINGGVSWTINSNNIFDMNGIRGVLLSTSIRVNSFPRMDVDRTCGPRAGYIYIVVSQKNLAPAGTDADIVIHRSTNGGTTWSAGVKVNQDALNNGKSQWFPVVRVDESGAVNVAYYDNRNATTTDSVEMYLSRSIDGGLTFTDIKVSDHRFKPKPLTLGGIAGGYQGDYIGLTSGNGKLWPLWMSDKTGIYQAWTAPIDVETITSCNICENFSAPQFAPNNFYLEFSGTNYWSRQTPSAYGSGAGSARFNSFSAPAGTIQSLTTLNFTPAVVNTYLTLDEAYAPRPANTDSLIIETSANGGASYSVLVRLWGNAAGGPLNTAPAQVGQFTPTSSQWRPKIYLLPIGTNKIKFRARSGAGNDIWVDNICVQPLAAPVANSIGIVPEGMWLNSFPFISYHDTVRVYLHRVDFPNIKVDSAKTIISDNASANNLMFNNALSGTYYKVVKHRNTIETWSRAGGEPYTRGGNIHFNFLTPAGQAYNNNQKLVNPFPYYAMFSGDANQDGFIDVIDVGEVYNDAQNSVAGYVRTDMNADFFVDVIDLGITYNNQGVAVESPLSAPKANKNLIDKEDIINVPSNQNLSPNERIAGQ